MFNYKNDETEKSHHFCLYLLCIIKSKFSAGEPEHFKEKQDMKKNLTKAEQRTISDTVSN